VPRGVWGGLKVTLAVEKSRAWRLGAIAAKHVARVGWLPTEHSSRFCGFLHLHVQSCCSSSVSCRLMPVLGWPSEKRGLPAYHSLFPLPSSLHLPQSVCFLPLSRITIGLPIYLCFSDFPSCLFNERNHRASWIRLKRSWKPTKLLWKMFKLWKKTIMVDEFLLDTEALRPTRET
jgi:hypothetical protein